MPAEFASWPEFCETATELARAAKVEDYTYFWWDVRPHPLLGTVEVRCADVQCTPERTAGLAALIQSLARLESGRRDCVIPRREALAEFAFGANRYGLEAEVPDRLGRVVSARSAAVEALALVDPYARELGCEEELDAIEMILREGNGADAQRAVFAEGGMEGLLSDLNRRSHGGPLLSPAHA